MMHLREVWKSYTRHNVKMGKSYFASNQAADSGDCNYVVILAELGALQMRVAEQLITL